MRCLTVIRALVVRILFAGHGIIAIWRLYMVIREPWCWYLTGALGGLFFETLITFAKKKGKEWKWFCPSVFFYISSVVPAIWFLELHQMEKRISAREMEQFRVNRTNNTAIISIPIHNKTEEDLSINIGEIGLNIHIPLALSSDLWLRVLEQFLLLILIVGRWVLPKGSLTHDQLSQLLLVYVGTAADIVEFFEAFNEDGVKYNRLLCYIILGIWTLSLMQFSLVLTASRARRDQIGVPSSQVTDSRVCCNPEIYGIITSIIMQDAPFLVVRLLLIFKYKVISYTNMFFTSKNSLVIILLLYRCIVVQAEARRKKRNVDGSPSIQRLRMMNNTASVANKVFDGQMYMKPSQSAPNVNRSSTPNVNRSSTPNNSLPRYHKNMYSFHRTDGSVNSMNSVKLYR